MTHRMRDAYNAAFHTKKHKKRALLNFKNEDAFVYLNVKTEYL